MKTTKKTEYIYFNESNKVKILNENVKKKELKYLCFMEDGGWKMAHKCDKGQCKLYCKANRVSQNGVKELHKKGF